MPSYVIVWENNTFGHMKVKNGYTWPGHAAVNIGRKFDTMNAETVQTYVSYWPSVTANYDAKGALFGKNVKARPKWSFIDDMEVEGYLPDHVIEMPSTEAREQDMLAAWRAILDKAGGPTYKTLRKNCSTIVSRILHAGGFYAKKWAVDCNFTWSPADVVRLALKSGGRAMAWAEVLEVLAESYIRPTHLRDKQGGVVTKARSGAYCSTGAPCRFQPGERNMTGNKRHGLVLD